MGVGRGKIQAVHSIFLQNSRCTVDSISCLTVAICFIKIEWCSVKLFGKITFDCFFKKPSAKSSAPNKNPSYFRLLVKGRHRQSYPYTRKTSTGLILYSERSVK